MWDGSTVGFFFFSFFFVDGQRLISAISIQAFHGLVKEIRRDSMKGAKPGKAKEKPKCLLL